MFEFRTDLAVEVREHCAECGLDDGIINEEEELNGFSVTTLTIKAGKGEKNSGKPAGRYINADVGRSYLADTKGFELLVDTVSELLSRLLPKKAKRFLVCGLGNLDITADSIGPRTADKIIATRHLKKLNKQLYESMAFGDVCVFIPNVLGKTGIESAALIKAAVCETEPDCVIAVDALASRRLERLCTTIQLSDTGIAPGAGIANNRTKLNLDSIGVPVVSIGMPMVVDATTLARDILGDHIAADGIPEEFGEMFVTPKECDSMAAHAAKLIGYSINKTLHNGMSIAECEELLA